MTNDELQAAAARVRRVNAGEMCMLVYDEENAKHGGGLWFDGDRDALAAAWLAEEELRQEIGNLLDHWEGVPNDLKNYETLGNLPIVMERIRKMVEDRNGEKLLKEFQEAAKAGDK